MFVGAVTDLLSVALTAGMFHYGYFIAAILYGLLGGLIRSVINITHGKQVEFLFISTIIIILVMALSIMYINLVDLGVTGTFSGTVLGLNIVLTK
jgi:hypothetical protein